MQNAFGSMSISVQRNILESEVTMVIVMLVVVAWLVTESVFIVMVAAAKRR